MPDFTTRLRLEKQDTNSNQNTWGTVLNQRAIDMIDEGLAGVETIALTGVAVTLSTANGTTDQARNLGLRFTGTGGVTVTAPSVEKVYVVINDSDGNVTMSAGGTTVTIPNGYTQCVATNGTNFYNIGLTKAQMDAAIAAAITPVADAGTVKVTSSDTTGKYLNSALVAGLGIQTTVNNPASNETLSVALKGVSSSTSGQVLTSTGASTDPTFQSISTALTIETFTSSGTFTTPASGSFEVIITGGGGGGSGYNATNRGGGSGATAIRAYSGVSSGISCTVTIGAGGTGQTSAGSAGTAGGNSSFSGSGLTTLTANGGGFQSDTAATATGGQLNVGGAVGFRGNNGDFIGGQGGASFWGGGGLGASVSTNGGNASAYGAGGGAGGTNGGTPVNGGDGAAGVCIVRYLA